jgi:AAA domain
VSAFKKPTVAQTFRVLLVAPDKVGKTHALLSWPKPAVIDFEDRTKNFAGRVDFVAAQALTFLDAERIIDQIKPGEFGTLGIDSLSRPHYRLLEAKSERNQVTGELEVKNQAWPSIKLTERAFVSKVCAKAGELGMHLVATAYPRDIRAKKGEHIEGHGTVGKWDVVVKDVSLDFDHKVRHDFDFGFMLTKAQDGVHIDGACIFSSQEDRIRKGSVIQNFSFKSFMMALGIDPAAKADDDEPITAEEIAAIESYGAEINIPNSELVTLTKAATGGRTVVLKELTKGDGRRLYKSMQRHAKQQKGAA